MTRLALPLALAAWLAAVALIVRDAAREAAVVEPCAGFCRGHGGLETSIADPRGVPFCRCVGGAVAWADEVPMSP